MKDLIHIDYGHDIGFAIKTVVLKVWKWFLLLSTICLILESIYLITKLGMIGLFIGLLIWIIYPIGILLSKLFFMCIYGYGEFLQIKYKVAEKYIEEDNYDVENN